jgi:GT2 family glycosyltransferase
METPKVFIIILNYNGKDTVKKCLDSVFYSDYPNLEVVFVDNDSKDGSFEMAKNLYSKFHFIKNEKNVGFSTGNNIGIRYALEKMADYIFLLNNDAVLEKNTISKLIEAAEKEKASIFSPLVCNRTGDIWFSGGRIKWGKMRAVHVSSEPKDKDPYLTEYISGCAMLIKKEVFKKIGLLSEDYFLYYEDADFCVRAEKEGFKCAVIPEAKITHFEKSELDLSNKVYWLVISGLIFFEKNTPSACRIWARPYLHLRKVKNLLDNLNSRNKYAPIVKKAYNDFKLWKQSHKYPLSS